MQFLDVKNLILIVALAGLTLSCGIFGDDGDNNLEVPDTYEFTRNGQSTVAYPGQTDRLNMVAEMKAYVSKGNNGELLSEQDMLDMFENTNNNGGGNFSFSSDRQLKNKIFAPDVSMFEDIFARADAASQNGNNGVRAADGVAGLIARADGDDILVSKNGREFGQLVEKGLMGAVFYNQIFNVYLTDNRIGPDIENEDLKEGKNYTAKEHHFDEAFGYFGAPKDFESDWANSRASEAQFWANYSNGADDDLDMNDILMDAYIRGRTAIVNKDQQALNEQVTILYENLELLTAATAVHYINSTLDALGNSEQGEAFHQLSEAWAFVNAIKYSPERKLTPDEINQIKETDFGANGNFWNVTTQGLNNAKSKLVDTYPELESVQDQL